MTQVILKNPLSPRTLNGHPWVFSSMVDQIKGEVQAGDVVTVVDGKKKYIGEGWINPQSQILVRILTRNPNEKINKALLKKRITAAWALRVKAGLSENCRLVFSEADSLSGLIVDKFGPHLVVQTQALGMDQHLSDIVEILNELLSPQSIFEKNDASIRSKEGLALKTGFIGKSASLPFSIRENGLNFFLNPAEGQKTGFFLDQRENRALLKNYSQNARVLDCFCYTGGFSVHAAHYGAKSVLGLDISEDALQTAKANASANGFDKICAFESKNVFDVLKPWVREGKKFDLIILDPPAFAKSKASLPQAIKGYKEINLRAMQLLQPGGFLFTFSCSHWLGVNDMMGLLWEASQDANRKLIQVAHRLQPADHPIVWTIDETLYLKSFLLQVI